MFSQNRVFPGITHITDNMGVSCTLIEGKERALLFDAGYGMEDLSEYLAGINQKPVEVFLSHGHHDHVLGARWFRKVYLCKEDMDEFLLRTGAEQRRRVMQQAEAQGLKVPDGYLEAEIPKPEIIRFTDRAGSFERRREDLGHMAVQVIRVPGHTAGSIVLFIPEYDLLLTGDDWNPCTWMWFPCSEKATVWRDRMKELVRTIEKENRREIKHILCSHQPMRREADEMKAFLEYATDERLKEAPHVDMGSEINTHEVRREPEGWQLIFDYDKVF